MKTLDFIKQAVGKKVYLVGDGDIGIDRTLRTFVNDKTELVLVKLTKNNRAIVRHGKQDYSVSPKNVREFEDTTISNLE